MCSLLPPPWPFLHLLGHHRDYLVWKDLESWSYPQCFPVPNLSPSCHLNFYSKLGCIFSDDIYSFLTSHCMPASLNFSPWVVDVLSPSKQCADITKQWSLTVTREVECRMVRCYEPEHTGGFCQTFKFSVRTWGEIGLYHCSHDVIVTHPTHSFFISLKFSSQ